MLMRSAPPCRGCYFSHCAHKLCMDAIETERVIAQCEALLAEAQPRAEAARQDGVPIPPRLAGLAAKGRAALRALAKAPAAPA